MNDLQGMGFSPWFRERLDAAKAAAHTLARVIAVHRDRYVVSEGEDEVLAELSGNLFYTADSATDLPTTGDWVYADFFDDDTHAIIHGVLPRKTLLTRKTPGKQVEFQLVAANIDVAFIVQSADYNFNLRRLERYLVMVNESGITPYILLSKCDLMAGNEVDEIIQRIANTAPGVAVMAISNVSGKNIDVIRSALTPGATYCLIGSSGVGKTTLLNSIVGDGQYETQSVSSKQNKGRHTTTSRELIRLDGGAMLVDTPGMRELGNLSVDAGIDETFSEIVALTMHCKFSDCSHTSEKGCAILAALENGELSEERYGNYVKLKNESTFNDMSYVERRKKDKDFGKMIKAVMKDKKR